jgi:TolB-like protein/DNA-binding winged helix-turn-helix (wHTH) protein/Tfp pilus assembly protein PilF
MLVHRSKNSTPVEAGPMSGRTKAPIQIGEWVADPQTDTISRGGDTQKLEPRTMRLLLLLAENPGDVVSVDRMLNEVWLGVVVSPASVYQAISQLRRTLGDSDSSPTYLATVPRKGYRLIAAVRAVTPTAPAQLTSAQTTPPAVVPPPVVASGRRMRWPWMALVSAAIVLSAVVVIARHYWWAPPVDVSNSIVVLPFTDMTEDRRDQVFCDGLTEELSNWLAQIPTLRVVATTSAFAFRGQRDAREIGKALNTTHVLEGSIRRSGNHLRVDAQLIDARTGYQVWGDKYDQEVDDTIQTQELIARAVAGTLQIRLTSSTTQKFAERHGDNPQAYNIYLMASHLRLERTRESTTQAIERYQQALVVDPNFALAYVGLAYAYLNQHWVDTRSVTDVAEVVEPLLDTALRLDPQLSELYTVRGALRSEQLRLDEAQRDLQRAVAMNPNNSWGFAELGRLYTMEGRPRDALEAYQHTLVLDPLDFLHHARQCVALMDMSRYPEAEKACARARSLQDQGNFGTVATAWLERTRGNIPESLRWNAEALGSAPEDMDLYQQRGDLLMTIGLSELTRETYQRALNATHNAEEVNLGMAAVVFHDGGATALRAHLVTTGLDASMRAHNLIKVAYYHLLAGDDAAAQRAIARARTVADFNAAALNDAWYARWGESDLLIVAQCEQRTGDQDSANRHLHEILTLLDQEVAAGMNRFGTYALRAEVLALLGDSDGAMQALTRAADLGWRREWWAQRIPFFVTLRARNDFRSLMARVAASNETLIANAHAQLAH